jgi:4-amino-4-deoxy-L-arabinose transferase-like glycosyltransferase
VSVRRQWRASLGWAAFALVARLVVVAWAWGRFPPTADGSYYHRLASRLATGDGYTWLWPDGAVTYAAHYPVGYPALVAAGYRLFGATPGVAMVINALLGALGVFAVHRMLLRWRAPRLAAAGAAAVALHPGLLLYTPALMTEGVTASLLACALWLVVEARASGRRSPRARRGWLLALGLALGGCVLLRPQCLLLVPCLGLLASPAGEPRWRRMAVAALVTVVALAAVAPWTLRNCQRMGRCALVSVNGGWNLLIGTQAKGQGGWAPLEVPRDCREVFDEAGKDRCFGRAALGRVAAAPLEWAALAPRKLAVTLDYCGAPGWYLHEANEGAFGARAKLVLGVLETVYERAVLLLALAALWPRRRRGLRRGAWLAAALASATRHGWLGHVGLLLLLGLQPRRLLQRPPLYGALAAALAMIVAVHAVFFGSGRYALMLATLLTPMAAIGAWRLRGAWRSLRARA